MIFVLLLLCGCGKENSETRFLLDTVVRLNAQCDDETLSGAFALCEHYEKMLSRSLPESDVSRINSADGAAEASDDTVKIISRSLYYSKLSDGKFDITVCPVSMLWDFNNEVVPSRDEIAAALKSVDYESIKIEENRVDSGGASIDLGGIAKGYIADRLKEYFESQAVKRGIISLGGSITVFGDKSYNVGIKKPFEQESLAATLRVKNTSVVTSGIYERCFEREGVLYHHIIDPATGYPCETDLLSATIIGESALDCDALSTLCVLVGKERAAQLIEAQDGFEAVFIDSTGALSHTSGIKKEKGIYTLRS